MTYDRIIQTRFMSKKASVLALDSSTTELGSGRRSPHLLCKIVKYDLINGIISRVHGLNNSITTYSVFK
jgi:hypothetical protein